MTVAYRCDGPDCTNVLDKDAPRIALVVENEPAPEPPVWMDGDPLPLIDFAMTIGFDGDHHFCSASCLAQWAYHRHLANLPEPPPPGDTAP